MILHPPEEAGGSFVGAGRCLTASSALQNGGAISKGGNASLRVAADRAHDMLANEIKDRLLQRFVVSTAWSADGTILFDLTARRSTHFGDLVIEERNQQLTCAPHALGDGREIGKDHDVPAFWLEFQLRHCVPVKKILGTIHVDHQRTRF